MMPATFPYDESVAPPAPKLPCRFSHPLTGAALLADVALDTGADITVLPQGFADELHLPNRGRRLIAGADGSIHQLATAEEAFETLGVRFDLEVLLSLGEPCPLLGRDVLNRFRLTLDGPQRQLSAPAQPA